MRQWDNGMITVVVWSGAGRRKEKVEKMERKKNKKEMLEKNNREGNGRVDKKVLERNEGDKKGMKRRNGMKSKIKLY